MTFLPNPVRARPTAMRRWALVALATALLLAGMTGLASKAHAVTGTALEIDQAANGATSGSAFTSQPQLQVVDGNGADDTGASGTIAVTVTAGGTLIGTTSMVTSSGAAAFTDLGLIGGSLVTLTYTFTGTVTGGSGQVSFSASQEITPVVGASNRVVVATAAAGAYDGAAFATQPKVYRVASDGTTIVSADPQQYVRAEVFGGGTLVGTRQVLTVNGVAQFTDLGVSGTPGQSYTVHYSIVGLGTASQSVTIGQPANRLVVSRPAVATGSGAAFTVQPQITLQDVSTNQTVSNSATTVTATVSSGASLIGTTSATTSSGIATFTNLGITGTPGQTYTLTFTSAHMSVTQAVTMPVSAGTHLLIVQKADDEVNGHPFGVQPIIRRVDAHMQNATADPQTTVTMTVSAGAYVIGSGQVVTERGIADFDNVGIVGSPGATYTLTFSAPGMAPVSQTITLHDATIALLSTKASGVVSGKTFATQPVVFRSDATGALTPDDPQHVVTASVSAGASLIGTTSITTVKGVASFTNLGIVGTPGIAYTITYSMTGLTPATQTIVVSTSMPTPAPTPTTRPTAVPTADVTGTAVGGGITVTHTPVVAPTQIKVTPASSTASAPVVKRSIGHHTLHLSGLRPYVSYKIAIHNGGKWVPLGSATTTKAGKLILPSFHTAKAGAYPIRLTTSGRSTYFKLKVKR